MFFIFIFLCFDIENAMDYHSNDYVTLYKICFRDSSCYFSIVDDQFGQVHVAKNGGQLLRTANQPLGAESGL